MCKLCSHPNSTLFHILCNCIFSLRNKRFEWRHDSVLRTIAQVIYARIQDQNSKDRPHQNEIKFVPAGSKHLTTRRENSSGLLTCANDRQCLVDYSNQHVIFPPTITATDKRPDIVIWSETAKKAILIELTVPNEDNIVDAEFRKKDKYGELVEACRSASWETHLLTVEVGVRGFVAGSFRRCLKLLGVPNPTISRTSSAASKTALRCSYSLFLARNLPLWKPLDLLVDSISTDSPRSADVLGHTGPRTED